MADFNYLINLLFGSNASETKKEVDNLNKSIEQTSENTEQVTKATNSSTNSFKSNTHAVLENGGAMGILNDLTGGYAMLVKDAVEASALFTKSTKAQTAAVEAQTLATRLASVGLKTLKVAMAATGIGLLISAAALLVHNWDRITKAFKDFLPSAETVNSTMNKLTQIAVGVGTAIVNYVITPFKAWARVIKGDFKGAMEEIKSGLNVIANFNKGVSNEKLAQQEASQQKQLESLIKHNEQLIEVQKAAGKDTFALELQNSKLKQKLYKDDNAKLAEEQQKEKVLRATHQKDLADKAKAAADKAARDKEEADKKQKEKDKEAEEKRIQGILDRNKAESDAAIDLSNTLKTLAQEQSDLNDKQAEKDSELGAFKINQLKTDFDEKAKLAQDEKDTDQAVFDNKVMLAEQLGVALGNLSGLLKQGSKEQKIAALATIAINTAIGFIQGLDIAQKSASGTGPAAAFAFPIFYASQVAAVLGAAAAAKSALSSGNSASTSGGGGGSSTRGAIPASAQPNLTFVGSANNQLASSINQGTINQTRELQAKPIKAFVVSTEVSTQQALDRKIASANSIT